MAIQAIALSYSCSVCGWKKTVSPTSDALLPGEFYHCCPNCENPNLQTQKLDALSSLVYELRRKIYNK
mgnify:FL=1